MNKKQNTNTRKGFTVNRKPVAGNGGATKKKKRSGFGVRKTLEEYRALQDRGLAGPDRSGRTWANINVPTTAIYAMLSLSWIMSRAFRSIQVVGVLDKDHAFRPMEVVGPEISGM